MKYIKMNSFNIVMYELISHSKCAKCLRDEQYSVYNEKEKKIILYREDSPKLTIYDYEDFKNSKLSKTKIEKIVKNSKEYLQMKSESELIKGFITIIKNDRDKYRYENLYGNIDHISLNYCYDSNE